METTEGNPEWKFHRFHLLVTGETEQAHLPKLFRALMSNRRCTFQVAARISQLNPISSPKQLGIQGAGTRHRSPSREQEIGLKASRLLRDDANACVVVIDDLEYGRRHQAELVFRRYRDGIDGVLDPGKRRNASVHFLVNMLEAYYFADPNCTNSVLGTNLPEPAGDVEEIRNPKAELKKLAPDFREILHGGQILDRLNLIHILSNPEQCRSLRTLVKWCISKMGEPMTDEQFHLQSGKLNSITSGQLQPNFGI